MRVETECEALPNVCQTARQHIELNSRRAYESDRVASSSGKCMSMRKRERAGVISSRDDSALSTSDSVGYKAPVKAAVIKKKCTSVFDRETLKSCHATVSAK